MRFARLVQAFRSDRKNFLGQGQAHRPVERVRFHHLLQPGGRDESHEEIGQVRLRSPHPERRVGQVSLLFLSYMLAMQLIDSLILKVERF